MFEKIQTIIGDKAVVKQVVVAFSASFFVYLVSKSYLSRSLAKQPKPPQDINHVEGTSMPNNTPSSFGSFLSSVSSRLSSARPAFLSPSFWETESSKQRKAYQEAIHDYHAMLADQGEDIKKVRLGLQQCAQETHIRNNEIRQEILVLRGEEDVSSGQVLEYQPDAKSERSPTQETRDQQAALLQTHLRTYPMLREHGRLDAAYIREVLGKRIEHHAQLMALAHQFIPDSFLDLMLQNEASVMRLVPTPNDTFTL